jgi:hypothetical protein
MKTCLDSQGSPDRANWFCPVPIRLTCYMLGPDMTNRFSGVTHEECDITSTLSAVSGQDSMDGTNRFPRVTHE